MSYLTRAAVELALLGALSGVVGTLIILRKRAFFAVALSHATFPGGVLFAIAGWNVLIGQALFALLLVGGMTLLARVPRQGRQVTSGIVLAFGFALGTLLAALNPGLGVPVDALLVGSPLSVTLTDIVATLLVLIASAGIMLVLRRRMVFHSFDPAGYEAAGFEPRTVEFAAVGIIAAGVVVAMPAVGAILGVAILIAPAVAARLLAKRMSRVPLLAAAIGIASALAGLWASTVWNIAAGGAVGLATTLTCAVALVVRWRTWLR